MANKQDELRDIDREFLDACKRGRVSDAQAAIADGANPHVRGDFMETAAHRSMQSYNPEMISYVFDTLGLGLDARDDMEQTPAHWAARADNGDGILALNERRADLTIRNESGMTAEHVADAFDNQNAKQAFNTIRDGKKAETGFASRVGRSNSGSHQLRLVQNEDTGQDRGR